MSEGFSKPSPANGMKWGDHLDRLLVIEPIEVDEVRTSFGEKLAVRANITVIGKDNTPETFSDVLIFPTVLVQQTKDLIGHQVLGRLEKGLAKAGQQPPWRLAEPTDKDIELAEAALAKFAVGSSNGKASNKATAKAAATVDQEPPPF